ncbi:hypothetical protein JDV02_009419 [Purpureocillium takamizusanense]|uniref:Uncharacterized protein n=1 Tax=Purpureocillium takamizusanense TaxID=2060973 RepID=A0A9Q8QPW9_9HYPO|nr:uncharacterized protein JDV02_009419 [Purpureocillium takamizusanense]UNI23610.1 hypothetical protein JDV02_009419 [Purpureocillium takamizusanense]
MVVHEKWDYLVTASSQDYHVALSKYWAHEMWSRVFDIEETAVVHSYTYEPLALRLVMFEQLRVAFGVDIY